MRRATLLSAIAGAAIAVLGIPGTALAGGGCHMGATQSDQTGAEEATVRMVDACFTPSLTTVDPGTRVAFVNEDWTTHDVGGGEWGYGEDMNEGDAFTATFSDPGIYPFACSYHPGMTGAIVVGDGTGVGNGQDVSIVPFEPVADTEGTVPVAESGGGSPLAFLAVGGLGAALGAGIAIGLLRARTAKPVA